MISSARASTAGGIVRPRALAVFKLMIRKNVAAVEMHGGEADAGRALQQEDGQVRVAEEPARADRHPHRVCFGRVDEVLQGLVPAVGARTAIIPGTTQWCATGWKSFRWYGASREGSR